MAKTGLTNVTTSQTFQTWLDKTNDLVDIIATDALTASVSGDTTTGNATLVGEFTANTVIAFDNLKTNNIVARSGSLVEIDSNLKVSAPSNASLTLSSVAGPRTVFSTPLTNWEIGFENATASSKFIIDTGSSSNIPFSLSSSGDLTISGSLTSVNSSAKFKAIEFSDHAFKFETDDTPIFSTDYLSIFAKGTEKFRFFETGGFWAEGDITAYASFSDIRKKENIVKIDNALEKVSKIGGYTYNFKGDDRKITGVIAQELEAVLPEAVYEVDDEEYGASKAVRYGNIVGLLIEAIKELNEEIKELKINR